MRCPPYPRTTPIRSKHACPRCGAWSPDPWDQKKPHHCQPKPDHRKEEDDGKGILPREADDLE